MSGERGTIVLVAAAALGGALLAGRSGVLLLMVGLWVVARSTYSSAVRRRVLATLAQARPFVGLLLPAAIGCVALYWMWIHGVAVAWQQILALTPWQRAGALEVFIVAGVIALGAGLLIAVLLRLRRPVARQTLDVALREAGLMAWLVAAWASPAITPDFGAVLGGASLLAARFEGEGEGATRRAPRLLLAMVALAGHAEGLVEDALALYAAAVSGFLYSLPGALWLWFIAFGLATLASLLGWLVTRNWIWRTVFMNRLSLKYLQAHDTSDAFWRDWFAWRHRGHVSRLRRCLTAIPALLRLTLEVLVGRWPRVRPATKPEVKPRVEVFLTDKLAETAAAVEHASRRWEAVRLRWGPNDQTGVKDSGGELAPAVAAEARRLWLLANYRFCSSSPCPASATSSVDEARALALELDCHLRRLMALRAFGCEAAVLPTAEPSPAALHDRLEQCFQFLVRKKPDWQDVKRFRMAMLGDHVPVDQRRLDLAEEVRAWWLAEPRAEEEYVFSAVLEAHVAAHDWAATVEDCRRWELTHRKLTVDMRRLLAESWFHYALEIDPTAGSALAQFALDQAAGAFFAAGARESLEVVRTRVEALDRAKVPSVSVKVVRSARATAEEGAR